MRDSGNLSVLFSESSGIGTGEMSNQWRDHARKLQNEGKFDLALKFFLKAHETTPGNESSLREIGAILLRLDRIEDAVHLYHQFLEKWTENGPAWNDLGALHFEQHKHSEAKRCFEQAVEFSNRNNNFLCNLANASIETGEKRKALKLLNEVLDKNPLNLRAHCLLGLQLEEELFPSENSSVKIGQRLQVTRSTLFSEGEEEQVWVSRVEDYNAKTIRISFPTDGWQNMPIRRGSRVILGYTQPDALWGAMGEAVGFRYDNIPLLEIKTPPSFRRIQRRGHVRISHGSTLQSITLPGGNPVRFKEEDLSATGVGILVSDPIEPGLTLTLELNIQEQKFAIEGRVVRQIPLAKKGYHVGIAFTDMEDLKRERIARHIHHIQLDRQRKRIR